MEKEGRKRLFDDIFVVIWIIYFAVRCVWTFRKEFQGKYFEKNWKKECFIKNDLMSCWVM